MRLARAHRARRQIERHARRIARLLARHRREPRVGPRSSPAQPVSGCPVHVERGARQGGRARGAEAGGGRHRRADGKRRGAPVTARDRDGKRGALGPFLESGQDGGHVAQHVAGRHGPCDPHVEGSARRLGQDARRRLEIEPHEGERSVGSPPGAAGVRARGGSPARGKGPCRDLRPRRRERTCRPRRSSGASRRSPRRRSRRARRGPRPGRARRRRARCPTAGPGAPRLRPRPRGARETQRRPLRRAGVVSSGSKGSPTPPSAYHPPTFGAASTGV